MPSRHVLRELEIDSYYHVYNRGVAKQTIFHDNQDKHKFLSILERHLNPENKLMKADATQYQKFDKQLELLCYCLMGNHFHLLFYVISSPESITALMRAVSVAYTMYYNKKYKRVGGLFQGIYKASRISSDSYLVHISRYIHLNPRHYKTYRYSSLTYYFENILIRPPWLKPDRITDLFNGADEYINFLEDYEEHAAMLLEIKYELADK